VDGAERQAVRGLESSSLSRDRGLRGAFRGLRGYRRAAGG